MRCSEVLSDLWSLAGLPPADTDRVSFTGPEIVLPSSYRVDAAAQAVIAAVGLAAAEVHRRRTGVTQSLTVDALHATAEFLVERFYTRDGAPPPPPFDPIAGAYRCGDGRWVRIHTNFAHHRQGILDLLRCDNDRGSAEAALQGWEADDFAEEASARNLIAALYRSSEEWRAHAQGAALAGTPPLRIQKIADAPPSPAPQPGERPLSGLRILDLTRIIAGPTCGRALAAHGAEVMRIASPYLPFIESLVIATGQGKRSAFADLETTAGRMALERLVRGADIFVQGYRPGGLAARGFGPEQAAAIRPGLVSVSLCAYGFDGPLAGRRGFDSIVQTACGINHGEAEDAGLDAPKPLPCQALDHASGYLMAFGALAALLKRQEEGGAWHVKVSLAGAAEWLVGLGRIAGGTRRPQPPDGWAEPFLDTQASPFGRLRAVRPAARLSETPPYFDKPPVPLGTHPPEWDATGS
ncbi:MAG: CoA transferase [Alphaproteobacteria bacterium]|nr:CoA transferase [Alphaproteobacteria bacterium]